MPFANGCKFDFANVECEAAFCLKSSSRDLKTPEKNRGSFVLWPSRANGIARSTTVSDSASALLSGDAKFGWGPRGRGGVALGTYMGYSHLLIRRCREAGCAFEVRPILKHTTRYRGAIVYARLPYINGLF